MAEPAARDTSNGALLRTPSPSALRAELEAAVLRDLLGPAGGPEEEVDEDRVRERYLVGMLAPRHQQVDPSEHDDPAAAGGDTPDEGTADVGAPQERTLLPSSFGMSFCVAGDTTALRVTARWGRNSRAPSQTLTDPKTGGPRQVWKRTQVETVLERVAL